jgi:glycerol uptake facilitator-like aquaporin
MQSLLAGHPVWRRGILSTVKAVYMSILVMISGKGSCAQINPAFILRIFPLHKIKLRAALKYADETAGAVSAALLLKLSSGKWFGYAAIDYSIPVRIFRIILTMHSSRSSSFRLS